MTARTKHAVFGFFLALPKTESGLSYFSDDDKKEFVEMIEKMRDTSLMSEEDLCAITLWLNAIGKGDLGDYCYSYFYNVGGARMRALSAILGDRHFRDDHDKEEIKELLHVA